MKKRMNKVIRRKSECTQIACDISYESTALNGGISLNDVTGSPVMSSDGIGTKAELAERAQIYDTLGYDLIAMTADDLVRDGIRPFSLTNVIDADILDPYIIGELIKGLNSAAASIGMEISGGEIAELGKRVRGYGKKMHFNWSATALGFLPEGTRAIDGSKILPGDTVISIHSPNLRCNGFTLARGILHKNFGKEWHKASYDGKRTWNEVLLEPSIIYTPAIFKLIDSGIELKGAAHVTGGGLPGNIGRMLKRSGYGATLDNIFKAPQHMRRLVELGKISITKAYEHWNMGNGFIVVADPRDEKYIIEKLKESSMTAKIAGRITSKPVIRIMDEKAEAPVVWSLECGK